MRHGGGAGGPPCHRQLEAPPWPGYRGMISSSDRSKHLMCGHGISHSNLIGSNLDVGFPDL